MIKVTYSQLTKALMLLGFERVEHNDFTAFQNAQYDALIVLPRRTGAATISPAHMLTVERTVTEKGIASLDKFTRVIGGVRRPRTAQTVRFGKRRATSAHLPSLGQ
jgi:hypothetical protein